MKKLGRGLNSLIEEQPGPGDEEERSLACDRIVANPHQPRRDFVESAIEELAASIREHGVLQPIVVRKAAEGYELVAGERRLRASRRAGLERIPAIVREVPDDQMLEIALVENLQREDLNPIEKAQAYRRYLDELGLTHQAAAARLGKDRSTITNQIRLLELSESLQGMVAKGALSMGHARALLGVEDEERRRELARLVERDGLSVREVERRVRKAQKPANPRSGGSAEEGGKSAHLADLERRIRERYATKARIEGSKEKGRISLEYYSMQELNRLLELLLPED